MKKLGTIEDYNEFILAIASGADINSTIKGMPLVEYYFTEIMRKITFSKMNESKELKKLNALIKAGADVKPLFLSSYEVYCVQNLVRLLSNDLELLKIVLDSEASKAFIEENIGFKEDLNKLKLQMKLTSEAL